MNIAYPVSFASFDLAPPDCADAFAGSSAHLKPVVEKARGAPCAIDFCWIHFKLGGAARVARLRRVDVRRKNILVAYCYRIEIRRMKPEI